MRDGILFAFLLVNGLTAAAAQDEVFPLEPPDTASPRGALFNLIDNVEDAYRVLTAAEREYKASPGLFKSDEVRARQARVDELLRRAGASLDLSRVSPALRDAVEFETVLQLKEVLDRIPLPTADAVPDAQDAEAQGITRWRIPHTGIEIELVAEEPRAGEFLFSSESVRQTSSYYRAVRHLPYLNTGTEGFYGRYVSTPGQFLAPKWLAWVKNLPDWAQNRYYGQTVWQWSALVLALFALLCVLYALSGWRRRLAASESDVQRVLRRLIVPVAAILGLWAVSSFLTQQISFTGQGLVVVLKGILVPKTLLEAYIGYILSILIAERIIASPRIDAASLDANMIRMVGGILGIAVGLGIVFARANELGLPLVPLVASLGVGGLAVALAARPTIENLIGGVILYIDRPVRVGDYCSFGDHTGIVERIGVRSTQIRALDRTVITVPNAAFADMEIINWARCDRMQVRSVIGLRYETSLEQLRYVLAKLREVYVAHPKVDTDTVRVRFVGYGSSSLDVEIRVYALTRDWNEFFAIQEDVFLRAGAIIEDAGTSFAFPSQTLYVGRDKGLDEERGEAAIQQVESWRRAGRLPFPQMARSLRERLTDTLDYPPQGSPDASRPAALEAEEAEPLSKEEMGIAGQDEPERK